MDSLGQLQLLAQVILASVLGGVVGWERELARKSAGLRTHMFIAGASALFVILGGKVAADFGRNMPEETISSDPIRIIQAIVIGISFIGAGMIIQNPKEARVENLTTASSILLTAGTGIAVAVELYVLAPGIAFLALCTNFLLQKLEARYVPRKRDS